MGRSRLTRGKELPTARPEEGTGARTRCSRRPGRQERTPGSQLQSPPRRTHPCGPARSLRGRPQISPWAPGAAGGAGREKGVDSGAQAGRRAPRSAPGPPDASTQTQWVTKAGSVSAPRLPGLRRASGSSLGGREDSTSRFPQCWTWLPPCTGAASRFRGPLPQPVRPQVRAGDERIVSFRDTNRLSNSDTSPSDNSISSFSPGAVLIVIRVIIKQ